MAPPPNPSARRTIAKDSLAFHFSSVRTETYHDPATRGPGHHFLRSLDWNPSGSLIATGSVNRTIRIWNPERPNYQYSTLLRGHTAGVEKVLFNPVKESELASCSSDGTVMFWDVRSNARVSSVEVGGEAFTMSWSADGTVLLVGRTDNTLVPISVPSPSTPSSNGPISTSVTPDSSSTAYKASPPHSRGVETNATAFSYSFDSSDLDLFLTTGLGSVDIVSFPSFTPLHTLQAHTSSCLSVSLAPNGRYLAVGGSDALITLWDTTDWICKCTLSCTPSTTSGAGTGTGPSASSSSSLLPNQTPFSASVSPAMGMGGPLQNGLASNSGAGTGNGAVKGISWSWDGRFLVGACDDSLSTPPSSNNTLMEIFHAESGDSVYSVPKPQQGCPGVSAVAWHPSKYWLAYSTTSDSVGLKIIGVGSN